MSPVATLNVGLLINALPMDLSSLFLRESLLLTGFGAASEKIRMNPCSLPWLVPSPGRTHPQVSPPPGSLP